MKKKVAFNPISGNKTILFTFGIEILKQMNKKVIHFENKFVLAGIILFLCICIFISVNTEGTVDSGDSIMHYLYAKYAFLHPSHFLNHWAKPVFVLLSVPFAQFGFTGIKIFNSLIASLIMLFTYLTAKKINIKNAYLSVIFLLAAPFNIIIIFSGLTEPLFALFLILTLYLFLDGKEKTAIIVLSFLPFVRSEGIIILGVYAFFLLLKKKYKIIPLLFTGHLLYSIIGFFYYHDFLWVFTKIPYAKLNSTYGSGNIFHFANQLFYVIGLPLYILVVLGIISSIFLFFKKPLKDIILKKSECLTLIYLCFITYFIAHSLFWYFGIFNSMGLKRVLIGVIPLISLICLDGFNFLTQLFKNKIIKNSISFIFIFFIILFPFTKSPASFNFKKDFSLKPDQHLIVQMVNDFKLKDNDYLYYYFPAYISIVLEIDHFNPDIRKSLSELVKEQEIPTNAFIVWDNWFSVVEEGVSYDKLKNDIRLKEAKSYEKDGARLVVFVRNDL
mgnify:FL=1